MDIEGLEALLRRIEKGQVACVAQRLDGAGELNESAIQQALTVGTMSPELRRYYS